MRYARLLVFMDELYGVLWNFSWHFLIRKRPFLQRYVLHMLDMLA